MDLLAVSAELIRKGAYVLTVILFIIAAYTYFILKENAWIIFFAFGVFFVLTLAVLEFIRRRSNDER